MKTFVIIAGSLIWSLLFYNQFIGLNILLFSVLILIGLRFFNPETFSLNENKVFFCGLLLSAFFVFWYASVFPMVMFIFSLIFITTAKYPGSISVLTRPFISFISVLEFWLARWVEKLSVNTSNVNEQQESDKRALQILKFVLLVLGSILIIVLYFFLYRDSNMIFKSLTDQIEIDITPEFFGFTFLGVVVLNAIYNSAYFSTWINYETNLPDNTRQKIIDSNTFQKSKIYVITVMLFLLNLLLLFINVTDFLYISGALDLPEEITPSEMVHQAIGSLIFSIVVAMALLMFIFKNKQEGSPVTKWLFIFSIIWAGQNLILIFTSVNKNLEYIELFDLTYKRIGVLIYLLLSVIGLIFVLIKLFKEKSNWFVLKRTSFTFYLVLLGCSCINWPVVITNFNLNQSLERGFVADAEYLIYLDDRNLEVLCVFAEKHSDLFSPDEIYALHSRIENFREHDLSWQSFNLKDYFLKNSLSKVHLIKEED
jgi:hypothetical protein